MSRKQRMNTGSTTESEVVGVSDYLPNTIWLMRFLEAQGYKLNLSIVYQDNEAAIKMERNGKKSSSRRTRHFDIRFFNVKDKLQEHDIKVVYCPTENMVADFFTKPLQAAQFRRLRRIIMGMDPISILDQCTAIINNSNSTPLKFHQTAACHRSASKPPCPTAPVFPTHIPHHLSDPPIDDKESG